MLKMWLRFLLAGLFLLPPLAVAVGQSPPAVLGTWTGTVAQNKGQTGYTVVMTITANSAETEYPGDQRDDQKHQRPMEHVNSFQRAKPPTPATASEPPL